MKKKTHGKETACVNPDATPPYATPPPRTVPLAAGAVTPPDAWRPPRTAPLTQWHRRTPRRRLHELPCWRRRTATASSTRTRRRRTAADQRRRAPTGMSPLLFGCDLQTWQTLDEPYNPRHEQYMTTLDYYSQYLHAGPILFSGARQNKYNPELTASSFLQWVID